MQNDVAPMTTVPRARAWAWLLMGAAVAMVGYAQWNLLANQFYGTGGYVLDMSTLSFTMYRNGVVPSFPPAIMWSDQIPFFAHHMSLIQSVLSVLSYLFPLGRVEWFAVCQTVFFAPLPVAVFLAIRRLYPESGVPTAVGAFLVAILFAFGGQSLSIASYPHYEMAAAAYLNLTALALLTGHTRWAWLFLVVTCSVREDAGFHAFALLFMVLVAHLPWPGLSPDRKLRRRVAAMMAAAFFSSVALLVVKGLVWPEHDYLRLLYLGDPAFAHVSMAEAGRRLVDFAASSRVIYYPALLTVLAAVVLRDVRILLGWLAYVPWFLVNLLAVATMKNTLFAYLAFPFIAAQFWILLSAFLPRSPDEGDQWRARPGARVAVFVAVVVASTVGFWRDGPWIVNTVVRPMASLQLSEQGLSNARRFARLLETRKDEFGLLAADGKVATLAAASVTYADLTRLARGSTFAPEVESVAFFAPTMDSADFRNALMLQGHEFLYAVPETLIRVSSSRPLSELAPAGLLVPSSMMADMAWLVSHPAIRRSPGGVIEVRREFPGGYAVYGPYISLPVGHYCMRWNLRIAPAATGAEPVGHVETVVPHRPLGLRDLPTVAGRVVLEYPLDVLPGEESLPVEHRLFLRRSADIRIYSLGFSRCRDAATSLPASERDGPAGEPAQRAEELSMEAST